MRRITIALLVASIGATAASAQSPEGFSVDYLDRSVDACADFYQFACGTWLASHPLPADRSRYGRLHELADRNARIVRSILEDAGYTTARRSEDEQKIGDAYAACMDEETIEAKGARPLQPLLRDIGAVRNRQQLVRLAARFSHDGFPSFLTLGAAPDSHDSTRFIAMLGQGAMGLPDRDLYLNDDERSTMLRREYQAHVQRMFELLASAGSERTRPTSGATRAASQSVGRVLSDPPVRLAQRVMNVETTIARATLDRVALRDPRRRDNPTTVAGLAALAPNIDLPSYFRGAGATNLLNPLNPLNLLNPGYLRDISAALDRLPLESWKAYMAWRALDAMAPVLTSRFEREQFHFNGEILSGQKDMRPRWMRCSDAVAGQPGADSLGELVGKVFIQRRFGREAKARMDELITALQRSLRETLTTVDWMSAETRGHALDKLAALGRKIGGPEKWRDFSAVTIRRDDYAGNELRISIDDTQRQLQWIGQPVDRSIWLMTPQTVNAFYAPQLNEVAFPAGILQPPVFDATKDPAVNFGAAGAMIGHEMTHGFDDSGRRFDPKGNLMDWWTPRDDAAFRERAACVASQYGNYSSIPGAKLNGNLTLGENVADNGGVRIAYDALMDLLSTKGPQPAIDGFAPDQRFFIAYAQIWCENATDQDFRRRAQEDVHASGRWRANGVLQNMPEFRKAFSCREGAPMAPVNACRVW
ncbi:MAG TPA: M13 family metallopeptidase [Vicinamibacterales bacterium]|nr:M13 family metallopeptidase [Vicinamibacterales bacterium]